MPLSLIWNNGLIFNKIIFPFEWWLCAERYCGGEHNPNNIVQNYKKVLLLGNMRAIRVRKPNKFTCFHNQHPCYPRYPCSKKLSTEQVLSAFKTRRHPVLLVRTRIPRIKRISPTPLHIANMWAQIRVIREIRVRKKLTSSHVPTNNQHPCYPCKPCSKSPSTKQVLSAFKTRRHLAIKFEQG